MAPEEFERGALIDETSNVFTLGRYAINALSSRIDAEWRTTFEGNTRLADVLTRATQARRTDRYPSIGAFVAAFEEAIAADLQ